MAKRKRRSKSGRSRRLLRWGSHIFCGIAVILIFLTLVQCSVKKPEAPTWDTQLVIPLANRTYDMTELIEKIDQDNLYTDSLGNPFFYYEKILDTVTVTGSFGVADVSQTIAESLGVVQLDPFAGADVSVNLSDYVYLELGDIPPISFDIIRPLPPMGEFAIVTVESGFALVTIENNFGLDLDTVMVTINDVLLGGAQVTNYTIPGGIPAGVTQVDTIDLAGKTISNQLLLNMHCYTPGATSFSLSGKSLSTTVSMPSGCMVSSATARIPRIVREFNESLGITSDHQLESAILERGQLILNIQNQTNVPVELNITLPDVNDGISPLTIVQPIYANDTRQVVYDLSGYILEPSDQILPQSTPINIVAVIDSSGSQLVTISAGDKIDVSSGIQDVSLASVQGILSPSTADFENVQQDVEIPKGFDQVQLTSAVLMLEIENTVNIPGSFVVNIDGDMGQSKTLSGFISPGTPESPVTTIITDSNVTAFMDPIPEQLTVNGTATFGDGVTSGSVNTDDYVTATVIISSPLEMVIGETTFDGDWESTEIDQNDIHKLTDNIIQARVFTTIVNHLPLELEAEFYLSGDSATLYSNPTVTMGPVGISRGSLNPDGTVDTAVVSENIIELNSDQTRVLENEILWLGQRFTLAGTEGQTVKFTANDSLAVSGYIEVDFTVSEDLWED